MTSVLPLQPRDRPASGRLRLGLPAWAFPGWKNRYFDATPSPLASYARVFDAVEGNTTFYGVPDGGTVHAWRDAVEAHDFRFSFKLPRSVTHRPAPSWQDLASLLSVLEPLEGYLGPLLVQFPPTVGPRELVRIEAVLERIGTAFARSVEVRHPAFFPQHAPLGELLQRHDATRAVLDAGALYAGNARHPAVLHARHEKPLLPLPTGLADEHRMVRLVLHPEAAGNAPWIDAWADRCARWLARGISVTMMIHCPDNASCPPFARRFHEALSSRCPSGIASLPTWPVPRQDTLF